MMKLLLLLSTLAMPVIAWLSSAGVFGPDNGTLANRYPTLLLAAGYAFAIWSVIFILDMGFAVWQAMRRRPALPRQDRLRKVSMAGFALTAVWMVAFSQELFWLALLIIWGALGCMVYAALMMARAPDPRGHMWLGLLAVGLHAGWLSLAAFLNMAQVAVAYGLLPTGDMLSWSLMLWAGAAALLLWVNAKLNGHPAYGFAALWGLIGVYVEQHSSPLAGAQVSAGIALLLAGVLLAQSLILLWRQYQRESQAPLAL